MFYFMDILIFYCYRYYLDFCYRNGKTDAKNYIVEWYGKMEVAQDKDLVIGKYCKDCYTR